MSENENLNPEDEGTEENNIENEPETPEQT
jgi:hypothetical protein